MSSRKKYGRDIDARASELLREQGLFSVPVDVEQLARQLGADVVYDDLPDDVSGFLLREGGASTIAVNMHHHSNRQRFTLAHECGHLVLHADKGDRLWLDKTVFYRDASSSNGDDVAEIHANRFAAGVLMPEELIQQQLRGDITENDVVRLALRFGVSERAMTVRLISLGLIDPVVA